MSIGRWILLNPGAFGKFLIAFLALAAKLWLQITGAEAYWSPATGTLTDMAVLGLTAFGVATGINHTARGPLLPPAEAAAYTAEVIKQS